MENKKLWYAICKNREDSDWGTGSFDWSDAVTMAISNDCSVIVAVDANYDDAGDPTTDAVAVATYYRGEDYGY